ncbi:MAG: hypothetical protein HKN82_08415 [Akkermansiaceae bacterium]|nr:hypothetical protein [Akkermansiaceae bacterium]
MARIASILSVAAGIMLLGAALMFPWFVLPVAVDNDGSLVTLDAPVTGLAKAGLAGALLSLLTIAWLAFCRGGWAGACGAVLPPAAVLGVLLLWYPQWVVVGDAGISGEAAWLQQQHDSLTWLGGDVYRAHGERISAGGMALNAQDPPLRLGAFRPPMVSPGSLGLAELPDLVWWLGYNPAFAQFAGRGWFAALGGTAALALGVFGLLRGGAERLRSRLLKRTAATTAVSVVLVGIAALWPVFRAATALREARDHVLGGEFAAGERAMDRAVAALPPLAFDTGVIWQHGFLDAMRGEGSTPEAMLYSAWRLEREGYGNRSALMLERLLRDRAGLPRPLSRELSRSLLRIAIDDLNAGRTGVAMRRLELLCNLEPSCIQGRLHLQLAALQAGRVETNRRCQREIAVLYGAFQRKEKRGVLAASWWMLAQGEMENGSVARAAEARRESKGL